MKTKVCYPRTSRWYCFTSDPRRTMGYKQTRCSRLVSPWRSVHLGCYTSLDRSQTRRKT